MNDGACCDGRFASLEGGGTNCEVSDCRKDLVDSLVNVFNEEELDCTVLDDDDEIELDRPGAVDDTGAAGEALDDGMMLNNESEKDRDWAETGTGVRLLKLDIELLRSGIVGAGGLLLDDDTSG